MKKLTLSIAAVMAMSTFAIAGGDVKEVEPVVEPVVEIQQVDESNFYVGLGYSHMNTEIEGSQEVNSIVIPPVIGETDISANALTVLAGYNFNKYIAVEGRYTVALGDLSVDNASGEMDIDADMSNIAVYLKPMYPVGGLTVYGLLGYGEVSFDDGTEYSESDFQWGLGANYTVNENVGVFVDYTRLYDDEGFDTIWSGQDVIVDSVNVGVTYKF